jgi:hypothetical protein
VPFVAASTHHPVSSMQRMLGMRAQIAQMRAPRL